jgi:tetratricopeptide (TPR) repeat protein
MRKFALILAVAALAALGTSCTQLKARDQINKGVAAFKSAQYPEAVEHFKPAVELDPSFVTARLYLATAYMQQYVPGSDLPDNVKMASEALNQFNKVLEQNPPDSAKETAIASIASLYLNQKKWDEAEAQYRKLIALDPNKTDGYYSIGFIAWSKWYVPYQTGRSNAGMKQEDPGPIKDKKIREELKAKYGAIVDEGLKCLDKALQLDPEYDDAMAYENLLVRERADLADNKQEYEAQVKIADDWVQKALATKKKKAEAKNKTGGSIVLDPNQK